MVQRNQAAASGTGSVVGNGMTEVSLPTTGDFSID
jgi:hypothetical protein